MSGSIFSDTFEGITNTSQINLDALTLNGKYITELTNIPAGTSNDQLLVWNENTKEWEVKNILKVANGTPSIPSISFTSNPTSGMYLSGTNVLAWSTNSTNRMSLSTVLFSPIIRNNDNGTSSAPSYCWTQDTNTGMYRSAEDTIDFSTNSTQRFQISTTNVTSLLNIITPSIRVNNLTGSRIVLTDASDNLISSSFTDTDFARLAANNTFSGTTNTFSNTVNLSTSTASKILLTDGSKNIISSSYSDTDFARLAGINVFTQPNKFESLLTFSSLTGSKLLQLDQFKNLESSAYDITDVALLTNTPQLASSNTFTGTNTFTNTVNLNNASITINKILVTDSLKNIVTSGFGISDLPKLNLSNTFTQPNTFSNTVNLSALTASRLLLTDGSKNVISSAYNESQLVLNNLANTFTSTNTFNKILNSDGTDISPAFSFTSSNTSGMLYDSINEVLKFSILGTNVLNLENGFVSAPTNSILATNGSVSTPSYTFSGSLSGMYQPLANQVAFTCNGQNVLTLKQTAIESTKELIIQDITLNSGTANSFLFTNGTKKIISSNTFTGQLNIQNIILNSGLGDGSAGNPVMCYIQPTTKYLSSWRYLDLPITTATVNSIATRAPITDPTFITKITTPILLVSSSGSELLPSISFSADPNTGIHNSLPNELGIACNGQNVFTFRSTNIESNKTIVTPDLRISNTTIHLGSIAGLLTQGTNTTAVGNECGYNNQGNGATAVGAFSGRTNQGIFGVAIGSNAGNSGQGSNAVAIGYRAGETNQALNSLILNGSGSLLNNTIENSTCIKPLRKTVASMANSNNVVYNETTAELSFIGGSYSGTFTITGTLSNVGFPLETRCVYELYILDGRNNGTWGRVSIFTEEANSLTVMAGNNIIYSFTFPGLQVSARTINSATLTDVTYRFVKLFQI